MFIIIIKYNKKMSMKWEAKSIIKFYVRWERNVDECRVENDDDGGWLFSTLLRVFHLPKWAEYVVC
jgi:hypothetical protein